MYEVFSYSNLEVGSNIIEVEVNIGNCSSILHHFSGNGSKWVKINERRTLHDILKNSDIIVPGIPGLSIFTRQFVLLHI